MIRLSFTPAKKLTFPSVGSCVAFDIQELCDRDSIHDSAGLVFKAHRSAHRPRYCQNRGRDVYEGFRQLPSPGRDPESCQRRDT